MAFICWFSRNVGNAMGEDVSPCVLERGGKFELSVKKNVSIARFCLQGAQLHKP